MKLSSEKDDPVRGGSVDVDVKNGIIQEGKADAALEFLRDEETFDAIEVDEKTLVRKIDWMIMPLMWAAYNLQYLDKVLSKVQLTKTNDFST
ncbi:hypothetical protein VI817_002898 [Penicillium citrinum]|nr:hypothetical protein VI817_002898 [Penicillium citrinum]